ncbi:MAG: hypothetical protein ACREBH_01135 [Candidatus Micrarchaeaceae archaeon]
MDSTTEHCGRCGAALYGFSSSVAASNGFSYCTGCAAEIDMLFLESNTCSVCAKLLGQDEIKFVMPSRLYSRYFFDRLPVSMRLMCIGCYRKASRLNILRRPLTKISQIRLRLGKTVSNKMPIKARNRS